MMTYKTTTTGSRRTGRSRIHRMGAETRMKTAIRGLTTAFVVTWSVTLAVAGSSYESHLRNRMFALWQDVVGRRAIPAGEEQKVNAFNVLHAFPAPDAAGGCGSLAQAYVCMFRIINCSATSSIWRWWKRSWATTTPTSCSWSSRRLRIMGDRDLKRVHIASIRRPNRFRRKAGQVIHLR